MSVDKLKNYKHKEVYFITRLGLEIMLLHTNEEYSDYIAHRLFEESYFKERNALYKKQIFKLDFTPVKKLELIDYKKYKELVKCDPNEKFVDIMGNKMDSKGETNIGTVCTFIELLTGEKIDYSHPDIIKLTFEEREYYKSIFNKKILSIAEWDIDNSGKDRFPYQLEPDFGFKQFPDYVFEYFGWYGDKYEARRKIKEYIYQDKKKKLVAIERDQDSNLPFLMEQIIKGLHLRKRAKWKTKLI
ncbi:MAG: hypothetical protein ACFFDF_24245 [Candidatus Odinarchaeota archaeon]